MNILLIKRGTAHAKEISADMFINVLNHCTHVLMNNKGEINYEYRINRGLQDGV